MIGTRMDLNGTAMFAEKVARFGPNIEMAQSRAVGKACMFAKRSILAAAPAKLSGVGKKGGVKLGVRYDVKTFGSHVVGMVRAVPPGPWAIIERGRKGGYDIPRARKRGGGKVLHFADGGFARSVKGGPMKGKRPFAKGAVAAEQYTKQVYRNEFVRCVGMTFGG